MSNSRAANRYAKAILSIAEEQNNLDLISRDFEFIDEMTKEVKEFVLFLRNPIISSEKKKRILMEILQSKISDTMMRFILLLVSKNREGILPEIIDHFYRLRDEKLGILNVVARTTTELTTSQAEQLHQRLEQVTNKKVKIKYILDKSLKGGFTIQFNDTVWDASVRHQLDLLRKNFLEGAAVD